MNRSIKVHIYYIYARHNVVTVWTLNNIFPPKLGPPKHVSLRRERERENEGCDPPLALFALTLLRAYYQGLRLTHSTSFLTGLYSDFVELSVGCKNFIIVFVI